MNFGSILKKLRAEKKITQEELAKVLNVSRPTVGRYELNERFPDQENLVKLSKFFNVSVDYLLGLTDIREPADELIKKGEVSIRPPSDIEKIYESLPEEEKKMFNYFVKILETKVKQNQGDKESSATTEAI